MKSFTYNIGKVSVPWISCFPSISTGFQCIGNSVSWPHIRVQRSKKFFEVTKFCEEKVQEEKRLGSSHRLRVRTQHFTNLLGSLISRLNSHRRPFPHRDLGSIIGRSGLRPGTPTTVTRHRTRVVRRGEYVTTDRRDLYETEVRTARRSGSVITQWPHVVVSEGPVKTPEVRGPPVEGCLVLSTVILGSPLTPVDLIKFHI